mmetsp:Transcript_55012/g.146852  ORF Transcript_55012/g.146852 Transcript_55012/m.146852 type:complete len:288 (-) Transcript_55012:30-893(-)
MTARHSAFQQPSSNLCTVVWATTCVVGSAPFGLCLKAEGGVRAGEKTADLGGVNWSPLLSATFSPRCGGLEGGPENFARAGDCQTRELSSGTVRSSPALLGTSLERSLGNLLPWSVLVWRDGPDFFNLPPVGSGIASLSSAKMSSIQISVFGPNDAREAGNLFNLPLCSWVDAPTQRGGSISTFPWLLRTWKPSLAAATGAEDSGAWRCFDAIWMGTTLWQCLGLVERAGGVKSAAPSLRRKPRCVSSVECGPIDHMTRPVAQKLCNTRWTRRHRTKVWPHRLCRTG